MVLSSKQKREVISELRACLSSEPEIEKIVVFGSFVHSSEPRDLDVAVVQNSSESYLSLALKYRKRTRSIARRIPLDIIPLRSGVSDHFFLTEISSGETIYEKGD